MLFGRVDVNSQAYADGRAIGVFVAVFVIGLWPLFAGIRRGRPLLGVAGYFSCVVSGLLFACLGSLPVAIFFRALIGAGSTPKPPRHDPFRDGPFDPYATGKRSAF